ncbi:MAG: isoaspartyl peptidase/L-asparaginase family protein [Betaproteobacteria bacterium]
MILIVHGGAGKRRPTKKALQKLSEALAEGHAVLKDNGTALDAVVMAITIMEDSGLFNAGAGGELQLDGVRRLDASLMEGKDLQAGAVLGLEGIRNPIKAARMIMDTPHVMLSNLGAGVIAKDLEPLPWPDAKALRRLERIKKQERETVAMYDERFSTVGAVALDIHGNLAAGTSTGGASAMLPGRVGDSPIIGAGTYADNASGAVSCTGMGEHIIRLSLAKEISMNMKTLSPSRSARLSLTGLLRIGGSAGVIVMDVKGRYTIMHTTNYMASGYIGKRRMIVKERFARTD